MRLQSKWQHRALNWLILTVYLVGLPACHRGRQLDPQEIFEHARLTFLHGHLVLAQDEAEEGYKHLPSQTSEWAWKFRLLEADILVWRGLSQNVLALVEPELPSELANGDLAIQKHILKGYAYARLGRFREGDQNLLEGERLCSLSNSKLTAEVMRARGVSELERDRPERAEVFFRKSSELARQQGDSFLEATALLNLGVVAIHQEHYDESIDWSNSAYRVAGLLEAGLLEEKAQGNLAWAYYKMGDFDKALSLYEEAETRARDLGADIDQVRWLNNLALVDYERNQYAIAEDYERQCLELARKSQNRGEILDALTELAFVSVKKGQLDPARQYSQQAFDLAHADADRPAELYPLLVTGEVAARVGGTSEAERVFLEVAGDPKSDLSLRWEAQNDLAKLYQEEHRFEAAEKQFRQALATVEKARASLQHEDFRLPFLANATHLYDDYIHLLLEQGKISQALDVADYSRARTLAEGLGALRRESSARPPTPNAQQVARQANATILFYWVGAERSYLWAITPNRTMLSRLPPAPEIEAAVQRYRKALVGPRDVLETANADGSTLYETLVRPVEGLIGHDSRVIIIPDGSLDNLNFETLLVPEPKLHYLIEDVTVLNASSLRLLAASQTPTKTGSGKLLLIGDAVASNREYGELPNAALEIESIENHFVPEERQVYTRGRATAPAYLTSQPDRFSYVHFVAHGTASRLSPLDSAIVLSKATSEEDSFKLYARDIIRHPLSADLVTISSCYGAGARAYTGEGLVGLSWAFLRAGAHNVIGALWEASDASTPYLMNHLYGELRNGHSPDAALHSAKLSLLHSDGVFRKPFYWAPFQLYTGS